MRERRTRIGRPSPKHRAMYVYVPKWPTGWLAPENTGIPWTADRTSANWKAAKKLARARDLDYRKAEAKEKPQTIPTRDTFSDAVEERLAYLAPRIKENSLHVVKSHLHRAIEVFGPMRLDRITRTELENYQLALARAGLSPKTIHDRVAEVLNLLRRAVGDHKLAEVPCVERFVAPPREAEEAARLAPYLTAPELDAVLAEVRRACPGLADLAEVRAICGLRTSALAAVRWEFVQDGRVVIPPALMKDRRTRTRPYVLPIVDAIRRPFSLAARFASGSDLVFHDSKGEGLLAPAQNGGLKKAVAQVWNAAVAKALANDVRFVYADGGARGVRFEFADLRHIASTRMQEAGLNDLSRRLLMAHATGVEGRYVDQEKDARRSLEQVAALIEQERASAKVAGRGRR